jgi:hypothetical protein
MIIILKFVSIIFYPYKIGFLLWVRTSLIYDNWPILSHSNLFSIDDNYLKFLIVL